MTKQSGKNRDNAGFLIKLILVLVSMIIMATLIWLNLKTVPVSYLPGKTVDVPLILLILICILFGVLFSLPAYIKMTAQYKKKVKELTRRLTDLGHQDKGDNEKN